MTENLELVREFLRESGEILEKLDQDLVKLEADRENRDLLNGIFRAFHTLKGTAGFLAYSRLQRVAHASEELLEKLRSGERKAEGAVIQHLFESVDAVRRLREGIQAAGSEPALDDEGLARRARELASSAPASAEAPSGRKGKPLGRIITAEVKAQSQPEAAAAPAAPAVPAAAPASSSASPGGFAGQAAAPGAVESEQEIRLAVGRVDKLMTLTAELVLSRNRLMQLEKTGAFRVDPEASGREVAALDRLTGDIHEAVMRMRMQPVERLFGRYPRVVRDLSKELGKRIRLELRGEEQEVDRSVIEALSDPLVHLIRNACDHGLEGPAERKAAGKAEEGLVELSAYTEGGQIVIRVKDDGRGLDLNRIKKKAMEKGLAGAEALERMSPAEIRAFIFEAGFSTAEKVTQLSGRGVGMDVVKSVVQALHGTAELDSSPGRGTEIRLRFPLTLAIVRALLIESAGEVYALPLTSVLDVSRIHPTEVQRVDGREMITYRGAVMPLLRLDKAFGLRPAGGLGASPLMVAALAFESRVGLLVDRTLGQEEVVRGALPSPLEELRAFSGTTVLGDGRVALIVDVPGLVRLIAEPSRAPARA